MRQISIYKTNTPKVREMERKREEGIEGGKEEKKERKRIISILLFFKKLEIQTVTQLSCF